MPVHGGYIAWQIRRAVLPFVRVYGHWVEQNIFPLVSQFTAMADALPQQAYNELMSHPAVEEYFGEGLDEEIPLDAALSFYENLTAMYQGTLNLFAAGLFHVIEQQLALLTKGGAIAAKEADTQLEKVVVWYQRHFQISLAQFPSWSVIDELRLVANTTKHAEGPAATKLWNVRPQLFVSPLLRADPNTPPFHTPVHLPLGGDGLYVTPDDFRKYHRVTEGLFDWLVAHFEGHADEYYPSA